VKYGRKYKWIHVLKHGISPLYHGSLLAQPTLCPHQLQPLQFSSLLSTPACEALHQNPEGIASLAVPETSQCSDSDSIIGRGAVQGATAEAIHGSEEDVPLDHLLYD